MNTTWYINLYYKFRQYPISEINAAYKSNELRSIYSGMLKKIFTLFQLDNRRDGEIQGIISKNNYDHMLNKKAESNLEQEEAVLPPHQIQDNSNYQSRLLASRQSISSLDQTHLQRDSRASMGSQESRWLVQTGPNQKNMDVFYELMIKMIRISFRRLTIQAFAFDKYGKSLNKEGMHEVIRNNSEYSELYQKISAENREKKDCEMEDSSIIEDINFPTTIEELKYEFLKYCITCKVYNAPLFKNESVSESLISYESGESASNSSSALELEKKQSEEPPRQPLIGDNEIETLILRVSDGETCIFNHLIDIYLEEIRKNGNNQIEILGVKNIAQSVFEMASGKPTFHTATNSLGINRNRFRRGIFDQQGEYAKESDSLSNSNLLLATWFDLILFKESPTTLHEIIEKLVGLKDQNSYLPSVGPTDRLENSKFYLKVSSYLHLLILNTTKNLFAQSLCKINYLLIISQDVLGDSPQQLKRSFKDIRLRKFECKVNNEMQYFDNVKLAYDIKTKKYLWKEEAMELLLAKWKIIANVITEVCVKNSKAFFASIFQKCAQLLDQQLDLQVQLVNQLMDVSENITLESEIKQKEGEKCDYIKRGLNIIIKEIIGFSSADRPDENEQEKYLGINSFANMKLQNDRYRQSSFVNREESAQQLCKWSEIMNENIYIFTQYRQNLQQVTSLFKNNHIYIALWFNKFHSETKGLLKKLGRPKLDRIFSKFLKEIPVLWESINSQREQKKLRHRVKRCQKSKFRNRISSIKTEGPLSLTEKKAIVLNYMLKAELQLYSHYMQINVLSGQKNLNDFFEKQISTKKEHHSRPELFSHTLIKGLLLFSVDEDAEDGVKQLSQPVRKDFRHYTSNFTIEPRSFVEIENTKTMNNIEKGEVNAELHDLMKVISHFQKPMNIELDLKENWKERFGQVQVSFLGEVSDYIRYLNQINYLYEFWTQTEETKKQQGKKVRIQLLNGSQFQSDLDTLDCYFKQLKGNREFMNELELMKGETNKLIVEEQLSEMLKRIKIHNKQLYMINETIIEAENYFKLLASNLIGRDKNEIFKNLLQEVIITYKTNKREKPSVRMLDKAHENTQLESIALKMDSKKHQIRFEQPQTRNLFRDTLKQSSSMGRLIKRTGSFVSHFEFTPQYYKIQSKILRVNCLIAAFNVDNSIYKNIKSFRVLSKERLERLAIIGNKYYDKLEFLISCDRGQDLSELLISQELLIRIKNVYEKKLLLFMTTLINLNYDIEGRLKRYCKDRSSNRRQFTNIPEEHLKNYNAVLKKYSDILKRFIYCKIKENIKRMEEREKFEQANNDNERKENQQFSICRFIEEILELTEKKEDFGEEALLLNLEAAIEKQTNLKFCQEFKRQLESECESLLVYKTEEEKVEYLRKKLSYLLMREMYFSLNYDNDFLDQKSINSKRNYSIYEERISSFYEEIIKLDYEQYMQRKEEELKKRSIHLKNYEFKYQKQPPLCSLEKTVNQFICCLFNQLLIIYTSSAEYKMFTRRHKPLIQNENPHELFNQYCASEYSKKVTREEVKPVRKRKVEKLKRKPKDSITSIFAQIFENKMKSLPPFYDQNNQYQQVEKEKNEINISVLVYTQQKFQLNQSIKVYLKILTDFEYSVSNCNSKNKFVSTDNTFRQEPITEMELQIIKINERSLITMLKSDFLEKINFAKCSLIRKNLISNIQKLYINLDVRHKVFESFKDRILNYEMQKTKIYHQYMDYIRGLKLDVYSHMAGEESLPYIKIIHAVKLYRLQIKKMELEQRVNQEFEKNLQKWNIGILKNMASYDRWLQDEEINWQKQQDSYLVSKKNLFEIFHAVSKQMARQNRNLPKKTTSINSTSREPSNVESMAEECKITESKNLKTLCKKSIVKQKQPFLERKPVQLEIQTKTLNSSTVFLNKGTISSSTKPQTKYEKMSLTSKSQAGLKGLFIKYDTSNVHVNQPSNIKKEEMGRRTQQCSSNIKASSVFKKKEKRYQSAQKYRSNINQFY